ncbi:MAG: cytochrome c biogenesis protein CcsA [Candidatus Didemnitutus sp.]|nr:cytochrome c biogenesis protein CcsA [Candidatus Didemnitutus sp.]
MKRFIPLIVLALGALYLASTLREPSLKTEFDLGSFGRVPVLVNGRIKPLDTVARNSILTIQGRQRIVTPDGRTLQPIEWLADVLFSPEKADTYQIFLIENHEVLDLLKVTLEDGAGKKRFSYGQLRAQLPELDRQARLLDNVEAQLRTPFQKQVSMVRERVILYLRLKTSVQVPDAPDFFAELIKFDEALPAGLAAIQARAAGESHSTEATKVMREMADRFMYMEQLGILNTIPPAAAETDPTKWRPTGAALMESFATGKVDPNVMAYAALGHSWRTGKASDFNKITEMFHLQLEKRYATAMTKSDVESRFNSAGPFYSSMYLYVLTFLLGVFSWLKWPQTLQRSAFWLLALAFLTTTIGIATRMWLEGRPPVTNLYSSALGVGWGAVFLCLILERLYHNAIGAVTGGMIGFATLVIAHHLSIGGDTLEMMRAVLDSNFWLATHVVVITIGYSATYLAGFLAIVYILRGVFTKSLDQATADALARMVYGIVCFAVLFSLIGTVLGGIWADQSWGRFWGWDPKENGALLIVLWLAVILHARWGGLVKQRGLMIMAVFGNIVTSWSWFGTNMLGVGLHSYGFMDSAFYALVAFVGSQLAIMGVALIPTESWASFRRRPKAT